MASNASWYPLRQKLKIPPERNFHFCLLGSFLRPLKQTETVWRRICKMLKNQRTDDGFSLDFSVVCSFSFSTSCPSSLIILSTLALTVNSSFISSLAFLLRIIRLFLRKQLSKLLLQALNGGQFLQPIIIKKLLGSSVQKNVRLMPGKSI